MRLARPLFPVAVLGLMLVATPDVSPAVDGEVAPDREIIPLPVWDLFHPLVADPKEPRFQVSLLKVTADLNAGQAGDLNDTRVGALAIGENFGILRWPGRHPGEAWQLNVSAAVMAQFDLDAPSDALMNEDYIVSFPLTYRNNDWSARIRFYHQSSHLGDEYLLRLQPARVDLSFESLEVLVSREWDTWRVYGGGEYLLIRGPEDLHPAILHAGIEYRANTPAWRIGTLLGAWPIGGLDAKSWGEHDWGVAWSLKAGVEFHRLTDGQHDRRHWQLLMEFFDGPSPFGQFYAHKMRYWGLGLVLHL